jgi:hypothetical protein
MNDAFIVKPLKCNHCGAELPVMGQLVTFQCLSCFRLWVLSPEGLKPVTLYRAIPTKEHEEEPFYLPFWMIEADSNKLRDQIVKVVEEIRETARTIAGQELEMEKESELDTLIRENFDEDPSVKLAHFRMHASRVVEAPTSAEVNYLIRRLETAGPFYVYVPAFQSPNTYAYLKIGRLLTKRQPRFKAEKSGGAGRSVLCALQAEEALALMDFVFFATLPEAIRESGDFLQRIRLKPAKQPILIELPFLRCVHSFECLVADFHISGKLVELEPSDSPAPASRR